MYMYNINSKKPFSHWSSSVGYHASAALATHLYCTAQSSFLSRKSKNSFQNGSWCGNLAGKSAGLSSFKSEKKTFKLGLNSARETRSLRNRA